MAAGRSAGVRGADDGRGRFDELREVRLAAGGSAGFGGADDGCGTIVGRPWSRRWPREVRRAAGSPTMAAGGSEGFGGADYGRGWFGGLCGHEDGRGWFGGLRRGTTMAAGRCAGFGGADNGGGTIGGLRWSRLWPRDVRRGAVDGSHRRRCDVVDGRAIIFMSNNVHHPDS